MAQFRIKSRPTRKREHIHTEYSLHVDFAEDVAYIKTQKTSATNGNWVQFSPEGIQDVITALQIVHKYMTDENFRKEQEYDYEVYEI